MNNPASVVIYQNSDYVEGLLQELLDAGLIEWHESDNTFRAADSKSKSNVVDGGVGADAKAPLVAAARAQFGLTRNRTSTVDNEHGRVDRHRYVYSQAYYLQLLKQILRSNDSVVKVDSAQSAMAVQVGDFVEYQARFRANEVSAILDIATPELVAEAVRFKVRRDGQTVIAGLSDLDTMKMEWQRFEWIADSRAEMARAAMKAARVDFRSDNTKEYLGTIVPGQSGTTAVTICDAVHFTSEDHDRVLDGVYTVLGKATSKAEQDVPVLARNKVLNRLNADFLADILGDLKAQAQTAVTSSPLARASTPANVLDVGFDAKLLGESFMVLPIAIYA